MNRLQQRGEDQSGMALVYGDPGLGKTKTMLWLAPQIGAVYVRAIKLMSGRWLLETIASELGLAPQYRTPDLWRQCVEEQLNRPRTIIIDECDYLSYDARVLETLRDLHDVTGAPMVFIGMDAADRKLKRFRHLYDRFVEVVRFHALTRDDLSVIATQLCEVKLTDDGIDFIHNDTARFRQVVKWLYKAEAIARANNLKEVTAADLNGNNGKRNG